MFKFRYNRIKPFGICSASERLQKRVYNMFRDMEGVQVIADEYRDPVVSFDCV